MDSLQILKTDEFNLSFLILSHFSAVHRLLEKSPYVINLRKDIKDGKITEEDIRKFVSEVCLTIKAGQKHPDELALGAIAVALQEENTDFAKEYLNDLANLNISEVIMARGVAKECLKHFSFNQLPPTFKHNASNLLIAALSAINDALTNEMDAEEENYDSPFLNHGNTTGFKNNIFEVYGYDWNNEQPYNFKWKNVEIKWYKCYVKSKLKYPLNPYVINQMLDECLKSLENFAK